MHATRLLLGLRLLRLLLSTSSLRLTSSALSVGLLHTRSLTGANSTWQIAGAIGKLSRGAAFRRGKVTTVTPSLGIVLTVLIPTTTLMSLTSTGLTCSCCTRLGQFCFETTRGDGSLGDAVAVYITSGSVGCVVVEMCLAGVCLHCFPSLAVVELHPVVLAILDLARVLECSGEELAEVVVVGCVLEAEVSNV